MDTNTIREALHGQPFRPFTMRLNDGREYYIPHPDYVAVSRRVVMVVNAVTEAGVYLEPVLIASLQYDGEPQLPRDSGKGANP